MKGGGKMADAQQINDFLVDAFGRINKIEERAMTTGLLRSRNTDCRKSTVFDRLMVIPHN